jgi:hypothetical protein
MAMAASKKMAALGKVSCDMAKKEARRWGARVALRDKRYKPKAPTPPESKHVNTPGIRPDEAID